MHSSAHAVQRAPPRSLALRVVPQVLCGCAVPKALEEALVPQIVQLVLQRYTVDHPLKFELGSAMGASAGGGGGGGGGGGASVAAPPGPPAAKAAPPAVPAEDSLW